MRENKNLRSQSFGVNHFVKHVNHVVELTMDVSDNDNGLLDFDQVWFAL